MRRSSAFRRGLGHGGRRSTSAANMRAIRGPPRSGLDLRVVAGGIGGVRAEKVYAGVNGLTALGAAMATATRGRRDGPRRACREPPSARLAVALPDMLPKVAEMRRSRLSAPTIRAHLIFEDGAAVRHIASEQDEGGKDIDHILVFMRWPASRPRADRRSIIDRAARRWRRSRCRSSTLILL